MARFPIRVLIKVGLELLNGLIEAALAVIRDGLLVVCQSRLRKPTYGHSKEKNKNDRRSLHVIPQCLIKGNGKRQEGQEYRSQKSDVRSQKEAET